jgi:hypothetical protein
MKKISKIKGVFLDGDQVLYITNIDENNQFEIRFRGGDVLTFGVPEYKKIILEQKKTFFGMKETEKEVIDRERIERELKDLRDSRDVLVNQLIG